MTNQQILEKAIKKAIDGGWMVANPTMDTPDKIIDWFEYPDTYSDNSLGFMKFIFDHSFAKALWGEDDLDVWTKEFRREFPNHPKTVKYWESKLQQMVIADNPIKYLGDNI